MAFSKEIKRLDKSNVNLTITVPKDDVSAQYRDLLKNYTKNIQIPGFRKGKVPQEVLERKYGEALKNEAMGKIIESALHEYFEDENLPRNEKPLPYSMPELQGEPKLDLDADLQFSVIYDVIPEVKIGQAKGLTIEYPYSEVTDEDINRELEQIQERNSIVMDRDDSAAAQNGDVATIDYEVLDNNGQIIEDFKRSDFVLTIGAYNNIYKFDDDIIGMKKGETKEIAREFDDEILKSKNAAKMRITLTALKEKKLPALDDDLAQDVDEKFKTLDDLKKDIRDKLTKNYEAKLREVQVSELLGKIMETTPVVLPESMIKAEVEGRWRNLARYYNTNMENIMRMMTTGEGGEEREKEWRDTASKALHSRLIIETLMEEKNVEITDDDLEKEFERLAAEHGMEVSDVKSRYNEQQITYLKEDIKERRVIDEVLAENTLKQGKKENFLDFMTEKR